MRLIKAYWPIFFFIITILTALIAQTPLYLALLLVLVVMIAYSMKKGIKRPELMALMGEGYRSVQSVMLLLALIMMVIPLWLQIGTIPTLLVLGFKTLQHQNLVIVAFLLPAVLSMTIGTAMGTMSILMSSLLAIGTVAGIPPQIIVGAVVSGAYIGDRSALMSGSVHLNASVTGTDPKNNFFYMMRTLLPAVIVACIIYQAIGSRFLLAASGVNAFTEASQLLEGAFTIHWFQLSPLLLLISLLLVLKLKMTQTLLWTTLYSFIISLIQQHPVLYGVSHMAVGYRATLSDHLSLTSSGLLGIMPVLLVILFSTLINQLFEALNLIKPLLDYYLSQTKQFVPLSFKVGFLSIIISIITCSQTLMIVICGQYVKHYYDLYRYKREDLMLTIADYGIITVAIIPWNINGQLISALSGIKTIDYLPYAWVCLLLPAFNLAHSYMRRHYYKKAS